MGTRNSQAFDCESSDWDYQLPGDHGSSFCVTELLGVSDHDSHATYELVFGLHGISAQQMLPLVPFYRQKNKCAER